MDDFDGGYEDFDGGYEDCFDPCNEPGGDLGAFETEQVFRDEVAERQAERAECSDCGEPGESRGHQTCQYPGTAEDDVWSGQPPCDDREF